MKGTFFAQSAVSYLAKFLQLSYNFKYSGVENLQLAQTLHPSGSFILASWHEYCTSGILAQSGRPYCLLVSPSADGDFVESVCRQLGQTAVRGSSSRGGPEARQKLRKIILSGTPVAITVDGPKGPRRKCRPGAVDLAMQTGVPILPMSLASHRPWTFKKSWDQHKLPILFSQVIFRYGEVISVPRQLTPEEFSCYQLKVEEGLNKTEAAAKADLELWDELPCNYEKTSFSPQSTHQVNMH